MKHIQRGHWGRSLVGLVTLLVMVGMAACTQPIGSLPAAVESAAQTAVAAEQETVDPAETEATVDQPLESYKDIPVGFTPEGYPFRGDPNAPVTMIEYSDFECPFCIRYFVQTEPAVNEGYVRDGTLRVIFRDFPIVELHPNAPAAHYASRCVAEQGAALYWGMHDKIFQTQSEWSNAADPLPVFARLAGDVGADMDAYDACMADTSDQIAFVDAAIEEGRQIGVSGTPSFQFVDNASAATYLLVGAQPFEQFATYVDAIAAGEEPPVAEESSGEGEAQIPFWATAEGWVADPQRPGFNMAGDEYRGNLDAKVTVIEFSDFQCPYCERHARETQPVLDEQFVDTGQVLWVFKHFPLNIHPQAPAAGAAAECAADQGKFWEMHHKLFETVESWSISDPKPVLLDLAGEMELDTAQFELCLDDAAIAQRVSSDLQDGAPFVQGTPTFIVLFNGEGRIIPGALPAETFVEVLQEFVAQTQ